MSADLDVNETKNYFLDKLDSTLSDYSSSFVKSTHIQSDGFEVTTYCCKTHKLIIDVIGNECCLTATGKNIIYTFYNDDWVYIVTEVLNEIFSIINQH